MIYLRSNRDQEFEDIVGAKLHLYNRSKCEWFQKNTGEIEELNYFNFGIYDDEKLIGGAAGIIQFGWYFLEELWVDEKYRGTGLGNALLEQIEKCARKNNCIGVRTETWDFQARGFYEKHGYQVYATFEDCPPGTIDYFLKKIFN